MDTHDRKKYLTRRNKADDNFEVVQGEVGRRGAPLFRCIQCQTKMTATKRRNRVFHLIICPGFSLEKRLLFYCSTTDEEKPPLLPRPLKGMTVVEAKRVFAEQQRLKVHEDGVGKGYSKSDVGHAEYLLAKAKLDETTPIASCPSDQQDFGNKLVIRYFVQENIPFANVDLRDGHPRGFVKILNYLRPGFRVPTSGKLSTELLENYHNDMLDELRIKMKGLLQDGRATLMFDGSEDIRGDPMVNFLVRVMGPAHMNTETFFLTTVYTGSDTVDASYYVSMAEQVVNHFIGFEKLAGVVTDITGSVRNARDRLEAVYGRVAASQDQAHVADILMSDIGDISWVKKILKTIISLSSDLRRFRKLKARLETLMTEYNKKKGRQDAKGSTGDRDGDVPMTSTNPNQGEDRVSDEREDGEEAGGTHFEYQGSGQEDHHNDDDFSTIGNKINAVFQGTSTELESSGFRYSESTGTSSTTRVSPTTNAGPKRKARTIKKVSAVRFASCEKMLSEFMSLRPVLLQLIADPLFNSLYKVKNREERSKRQTTFVEPIRDEDLFRRVQQLHNIFGACTIYLHVFDSETAMASEVFEATQLLQETLKRLPPGMYPEPKESNRQELLDVLENRMIGPLPGRKQIQIRLVSDLHIAAALLDPFRTPLRPDDYMGAFRRQLDRYLQGLEWSKLGIDEENRCQFVEEMLIRYNNVRGIWRKRGFLTERTHTSTGSGSGGDQSKQPANRQAGSGSATPSVKPSRNCRRLKNPIAWWVSGAVEKPRDLFERKAVEELVEFARCTLSVSPTATATERTFSFESRIHPSNRSSLSKEKVRKILFCQWNGRVLGRYASRDEDDVNWEVEEHMKSMKRIQHLRSAAIAAAKADETSQSACVQQQAPQVPQEDRIDQRTPSQRAIRQASDRAAPSQIQVVQALDRATPPQVQMVHRPAQRNISSSAQEGVFSYLPVVVQQPGFPLPAQNAAGYTFIQTAVAYPTTSNVPPTTYAAPAGHVFGAVMPNIHVQDRRGDNNTYAQPPRPESAEQRAPELYGDRQTGTGVPESSNRLHGTPAFCDGVSPRDRIEGGETPPVRKRRRD